MKSRRERLRILHITAPAQVGGLESVVCALAPAQAGEGNAVRVAAVLDESEPTRHAFIDHLETAGVHALRIDATRRSYGRERAAIADAVRSFQPDVVHTHGYRPDVIDAPVARRLGAATISTVHGFTGGWRNVAYEWLQRRALREADAVVAVSSDLFRRLAQGGIAVQKLHLVPNAHPPHTPRLSRSDARTELGIEENGFVAGWVGRLSPEKGPDVLIAALASDAFPSDVVVAVIGDGPMRKRLEHDAAKLGVTDRVRFLGTVPAAARIFGAFDALILSSRREGTPMVVLEAVAAELPLIATSVGGVTEVVGPTEAMLVPANSPSALASAVATTRADPVAAQNRARHACERLRKCYSIPACVEGYDNAYAAALGARH